jgi:hypothetical protein
MKTRTKSIIGVIVVVGLLVFFFELPLIEVTRSGQVTFLGKQFASEPTKCDNLLGCYCIGNESISNYFFRVGYGRFQCP